MRFFTLDSISRLTNLGGVVEVRPFVIELSALKLVAVVPMASDEFRLIT